MIRVSNDYSRVLVNNYVRCKEEFLLRCDFYRFFSVERLLRKKLFVLVIY